MTTYLPIVAVRLVREGRLPTGQTALSRPSAARDLLYTYLSDADREHFVVLLLNTKHKFIGVHTAHMGTLNSCPVAGRDMFKAAILANAAAIIVGHNHPSGDPTPSQDDIRLTRQLATSAELLGINLLDHIIIGDDSAYVSLKEQGLF